ncbi:hypothetical protein KSP39_PZI020198 [Platanthera zijinensis]|uniref:Uncharacterized protein n=1 Tax=Platanthera zijinensis TaxID=2320716 RepID=A0AAP0B049_9ASPA
MLIKPFSVFDKLLFVGPEDAKLGKRFILCGSQQSLKPIQSKGERSERSSRFSESEGFQARQAVLSCSLFAGRCSIRMGMSPQVGFIYQLSLERGRPRARNLASSGFQLSRWTSPHLPPPNEDSQP